MKGVTLDKSRGHSWLKGVNLPRPPPPAPHFQYCCVVICTIVHNSGCYCRAQDSVFPQRVDVYYMVFIEFCFHSQLATLFSSFPPMKGYPLLKKIYDAHIPGAGWFKHKTRNSFRCQYPRHFWELDPGILHTCLVCPCRASNKCYFYVVGCQIFGFLYFLGIFGS